MKFAIPAILPLLPFALLAGPCWVDLGKDDFVQLNCDPDTFQFKEGNLIYCTGKPIGGLRSAKPYKNFELEVEWRHLKYAGNSGLFIWSPKDVLDKLPRNTLPQGIEIQVLDIGYEENWLKNKGKPSDWFTSHGDVFPVGVSDMKPFPPAAPMGKRRFPRKRLSKPSP